MITKIKQKILIGESSSNSIAGAAFVIAAMGIASRLLGLVRDRIFAYKYGAGDVMDAYYAAFKIPDLVFNLLIVGALSAAFVPVFTSLISREKKEEAWQLANSLITIGLIALVLIAAILFIFTPELVNVIMFGFEAEKQALVIKLTRVMLVSPIIMGISGIIGGVLNSFKKFFFYSLAPILYNLGIIIGALFLTDIWGPMGLAIGVIVGALLHLLVQIPEVVRCGFRVRCSLDMRDLNVRKVGRLMLPRTMGLAVSQINLLVVTVMASTLKSGSLSVFNFANNIQSVPLGIFGISFAVAAFPTLSTLWAQERKEEFIQNFSKTFRQIMFFVIPFSVIFIVLRAQIIRVVLGSGKFDWEDTILTFQALGIFAMSLFAQCLIPLLARSFYAFHNTKVPFMIGLVAEAVNVSLALFFIRNYQMLGFPADDRILLLVWAFTISTIVNMLLLFVILYRKLGGLGERDIITSVWKVIFATFAMAVTTQLMKWVVSYAVDIDTFLGIFVQLMVSLTGGLAVFALVGKLLRLDELDFFISVIRNKLLKPKVLQEESRDEVGGI